MADRVDEMENDEKFDMHRNDYAAPINDIALPNLMFKGECIKNLFVHINVACVEIVRTSLFSASYCLP